MVHSEYSTFKRGNGDMSKEGSDQSSARSNMVADTNFRLSVAGIKEPGGS